MKTIYGGDIFRGLWNCRSMQTLEPGAILGIRLLLLDNYIELSRRSKKLFLSLGLLCQDQQRRGFSFDLRDESQFGADAVCETYIQQLTNTSTTFDCHCSVCFFAKSYTVRKCPRTEKHKVAGNTYCKQCVVRCLTWVRMRSARHE